MKEQRILVISNTMTQEEIDSMVETENCCAYLTRKGVTEPFVLIETLEES